MVTSLKKRAAETQETPTVIVNNCQRRLSISATGICPSDRALKMQIKRARKLNNNAPVAPNSLDDLEIPEEYKEYTTDGGNRTERFLLADNHPESPRILIFGRRRGIDILKTSTRWYVDGTFSVAPTLFAQVFVIMGEKYGGTYLCVYVLLPDKRQITYENMLRMLIELEPLLNPTRVSVDFELAIHNAFREVFPGISIDGCFFHLVENLKRVIGQEQLTSFAIIFHKS